MRINLDELIKRKAPKIYKKLPRFLISIVERIVRQKKLNDILDHCEGKIGVDFLTSSLDYMFIDRELYGTENIDTSKQYIFVSNHPLGGLDGLIILEQLDKLFKRNGYKGDVKIVVNDLLMQVVPLRCMFIPINIFGRQSQDSSASINQSLGSTTQVIFFPAGLCSRKIKGKVSDLKWKKTFVSKALEYKRDIIPLYVASKNSWFFYFFASLRKKFGIKANLEMMLLPSQMFGRKGKKVRIYCGKPVSYRDIQCEADASKWTEQIRKMCYNLKKMTK